MTDHIDKDKLLKAVIEYVNKNQISHPETIYQCDHVIESACEFIEELCDIVGYYEYEDEQ